MREIFSLVFMIFFLSSLSCGGQEKVSCLDFPDGLSWDFGRAREEGGELVHSYRFTNASRDTVTIVNINVFCKCTRAAASARTFLPGESGEIRVGFSPYGYPGKISKSIRVTTEPKSDFLLTFTADIIPRQKPVEEEYPILLPCGLRFDRTSFNFAWMTAGQSKSMTLKCTNTSSVPRSMEVADRRGSGLLDIWCPGVVRPGEKAELVLTYRPDSTLSDVGFQRDTFSLAVAGQFESIPVDAQVAVVEVFPGQDKHVPVPGLSISNSYLNLHDIPADSPDRTLPYTVRNIGKAPLTIRSVDCPDGISCSLRQGTVVEPGRTVQFVLTVRFSAFPEGKFFETVRVLSNDPARPVKSLLLAARIVSPSPASDTSSHSSAP